MQYRLLVQGVDYSDYTQINSISINYGRTDVTQQPSPATFSASLSILPNETIVPIGLDSIIAFQAYDVAALEWVYLFSGTVSDVSIGLSVWGAGDGIQELQITGVGHLATYLRNNVGTTGFVKAFECDRVADIVADSTSIINITPSRATGTYEIAAVSNGNYDALQLLQDTANSSMSVLCDTPDPDDVGYTPITYTCYLDRAFLPTATFTTSELMANGLQVNKSLTRIVNKAWVTYGSSSSSISTIYTDATSPFAEQTASRSTYLHNLSDANTIAQTLLASRKDELFELTSLTFNTSTLTDSTISALMSLRNGHRIQITGLPFDELTSFDGFIEGWTWNINKNGATFTANVSNYGQNYPYTLWNNLSATDTWNTIYTATTTWEDVI